MHYFKKMSSKLPDPIGPLPWTPLGDSLIAIGVDLTGILTFLRGTHMSKEGGSVPNGVGYRRGVPSPAN